MRNIVISVCQSCPALNQTRSFLLNILPSSTMLTSIQEKTMKPRSWTVNLDADSETDTRIGTGTTIRGRGTETEGEGNQ